MEIFIDKKETVMKAEKEETSWPLDVAVFRQSSANEPVITYMVREKEAAYWMEEMALSMLNKKSYSWGRTTFNEVSITQ